ncbi:MAG: DUF692 domain-containing protein [Deltaproteobacteria bacterium]|nr:DUF692 domain-containing protein [Deltaproteobacteria bacterium]
MAASRPRTSSAASSLPRACGLGLRAPHYDAILAGAPDVPFFEVLAENHTTLGDPAREILTRVRERWPVTLHCVGMSLGSTDPLDFEHLGRLRELEHRLEPALVSDHLSWSSLDGRFLHDLLPLPYLEESIAHVSARIARVQDFLGRRIAIENVSSYATFAESELAEWEFLSAVAERADCSILLDVNNVHVSAVNHGFSAETYLDALPRERVAQLHIAGFSRGRELLLDSHGAAIDPAVWRLLELALERFGALPFVLERDRNIPPLSELLDEAKKASALIARRVTRDDLE